jgi:hypothetical protein
VAVHLLDDWRTSSFGVDRTAALRPSLAALGNRRHSSAKFERRQTVLSSRSRLADEEALSANSSRLSLCFIAVVRAFDLRSVTPVLVPQQRRYHDAEFPLRTSQLSVHRGASTCGALHFGIDLVKRSDYIRRVMPDWEEPPMHMDLVTFDSTVTRRQPAHPGQLPLRFTRPSRRRCGVGPRQSGGTARRLAGLTPRSAGHRRSARASSRRARRRVLESPTLFAPLLIAIGRPRRGPRSRSRWRALCLTPFMTVVAASASVSWGTRQRRPAPA